MGLAVSKNIAIALSGNIEVTSEQGKGSTFILKLPLTQIENQKVSKPQLTISAANRQIEIASFESKNYNMQASDQDDHATAIVDQSYYLSDNINKARSKIRNNII